MAMKWKVLGPGGGGGQFYPTISPHDENIVLESCDMTNSYISLDAGRTWSTFQLGSFTKAFAYDPVREDVIYAGAQGLFRSKDKGKTWELIFPNPKNGVKQRHMGDHGSTVLLAPPPWPQNPANVDAIAIDPENPASIYVAVWSSFIKGTRTDGKRGELLLYHSRDEGETFECLGEFPVNQEVAAYNKALCIYIDPTSPINMRRVYLFTTAGLFKSQDGRNFERMDLPEEAAGINCAGAGRYKDTVLLIFASDDKIFTSTDGGRSFHPSAFPKYQHEKNTLSDIGFCSIAVCQNDARVIYAGVRNFREWSGIENRYIRFTGVIKSEDMGKTWRWVNKLGGEKLPPTFDPGWIADYGGWWGGFPLGLGAAPNNPDVCYATDFGTSYKTEDGGQTWHQVYCREFRDNAYMTNGMDVTTCYGIHRDPFNPDHLAISYTDIGLFDSRDGGKSWVHSLNGVPRQWVNTCYWVEFDPEVPNRAWTVWGSGHDLPRSKMFGPNFDRFVGGVCKTDDRFVTQRKSNRGMNEYSNCTHILLDPDSPAGMRTLYVCAFGKGVYKSVDDGNTWKLCNNGIDSGNLNAWRIVRDSRGTLYLIVARGGKDWEPENPGALYVSYDKAESWQKVNLPEGVTGPNGLAVDPRDEKHLYLACWPRYDLTHEFAGGIYESFDGGKTWVNIYDERAHVYDVTIHPENPDVLFFTGFNSGVFRSDDGGKSWYRLKGFRFKWGHRVIVDTYNPGMIFVTTFGGSVYHGSEYGDPDAVESVAEYARPPWEAETR